VAPVVIHDGRKLFTNGFLLNMTPLRSITTGNLLSSIVYP
jgi:hypothetical protein